MANLCTTFIWLVDLHSTGSPTESISILCGSSIIGHMCWSCRKPYQGINFIIAHDGFTLYDLVAYNDKHNDANGEQNRDGSNDNFSWNCGHEGETSDAGVNALRQRQMRNMMLALMVSQGTPMVLMGKPALDLFVTGLLYMAYPDGCWYETTLLLRLRPFSVRGHQLL